MAFSQIGQNNFIMSASNANNQKRRFEKHSSAMV